MGLLSTMGFVHLRWLAGFQLTEHQDLQILKPFSSEDKLSVMPAQPFMKARTEAHGNNDFFCGLEAVTMVLKSCTVLWHCNSVVDAC